MNLKQLIDECITDWFYNHPDGYAKKPYDIQDLTILSEVLQKRSVANKTIVEILKTLAEDDIVKNRETFTATKKGKLRQLSIDKIRRQDITKILSRDERILDWWTSI